MDRTAKGNNQAPPVDPERKWIRLQELGLSLLLAIPFLPVLEVTIGISRGAHLAFWLVLLLAGAGFGCLEIGEQKRRELRRNDKVGGLDEKK